MCMWHKPVSAYVCGDDMDEPNLVYGQVLFDVIGDVGFGEEVIILLLYIYMNRKYVHWMNTIFVSI